MSSGVRVITDGLAAPPSLHADKLIAHTEKLSKRISERFPESGLSNLGNQLLNVAKQAQTRAEWIGQSIMLLRVSSLALISLFFAVIFWAWLEFGRSVDHSMTRMIDIVVAVDAVISVLIVLGVGIVFLVTLGMRIRRARALRAVHELRSMAHLIDMHQLSKDPEWVLERGQLTSHAPSIDMSPFEMSRYLDYCSELLSMTGKIGALYAQSFTDPVVVEAVSEVEQLIAGLSRKIWQKLMIFHTLAAIGNLE